HVARNESGRRSAIDRRTSGQPGCAISPRLRKRLEEIFGGAKTDGNFRRSRCKGERRTQSGAYVVDAAYHLALMARLAPQAHPRHLKRAARPSSSRFGEAVASTGAERTRAYVSTGAQQKRSQNPRSADVLTR